MEKIKSFCVDHNKLDPGIYISRVDCDITTYDIRLVKPNTPPFLANPVLHTFEHLFATFVRNSEFAGDIIYFGPMGCRTGFYFLVRNISNANALELIKDTIKNISEFEGEIPGNKKEECGNYLEHDLEAAKYEAKKFYKIIKNYSVNDLNYQ